MTLIGTPLRAGDARQPADVLIDELTDEPVTCIRIEEVTHDVRTFVLAHAPVAFDAGQYLTVTVEVDGVEQQRCYTISSPPTRDELTITVKRVPGGPVSNWLHDHLRVGDTLRVSGPYGHFSLAEHPARRYLFLSAGSGVTPLMSMTRTLVDVGEPADVVFVHSARTPDDIVFRRELDDVAALPGFVVAAVCESDSPGERWAGPTGRLSLRTLLQVADLHDREVLVCGPAGYMDAARELLALAGVDPSRCHEESFVLAGTSTAAGGEGSASVEPSTRTGAVEFRRSARTVECAAGETILDAALREGLRPPWLCREGVCGTCKTGLVDGEVDMRHGGGIRPREIDRGQILICCSSPLGDVVLDA